jgi:SAM-dependent methyltransferase
MSERYLECISGVELERLQAQHNAWLPETLSLLKDAGFSSCRKVLEVGCGPGFTTLEIASSISPSAAVTAVDVSLYYLNHLRREVNGRGLSNVTVVEENLMEQLPSLGEHDAAFCRWFLAWVTRELDCAIANVHRSLRAGGVFAAMEYLTLRSTCHSPPCSALPDYIQSWENFYRDCGGTTEMGSFLPKKLLQHGFEILDIRCVGGYAPKGHRLFNWWHRLFEDFHQRFQEKGLLGSDSIESLKSFWRECDRSSNAFIYSPILLQVIARKK